LIPYGSRLVGDQAQLNPEITDSSALISTVDVVDATLDSRSGTFGGPRKQSDKTVPSFRLESQEQRILFSADAAAFDLLPISEAAWVSVQQTGYAHSEPEVQLELGTDDVKEMYLVDNTLPHISEILESLALSGVAPSQIKSLDGEIDAIAGISTALDTHQGLSELHIVSSVSLVNVEVVDSLDVNQLVETERQELVFVSPDVDDLDTLLSGLHSNIEVHILDGQKDGVEQIIDVLSDRRGIDAIHLIGEGTQAQMHLAESSLSLTSIEGQYAEQFRRIGQSLSANADLLIYGCNFGEGAAGESAVHMLAQLTGADVAASDNRTGHAEESADWILETRTGSVESSVVIAEQARNNWKSALATFTVTNVNTSGVGSLRWAIEQANASAGADSIIFDIAGSGTQNIGLGTTLPTITDTVSIDGTTQTGWIEQTFMPIVIDGNGGGGDGLTFSSTADGSEVRGLIIRDFSGSGIHIQSGSTGNTIAGNWIGRFNNDGNGSTAFDNTVSGNYFSTRIDGNTMLDAGARAYGVVISNNANNNTVGGLTQSHGNVIAGVDRGVEVIDSSNNTILNNRIGLGADGTSVMRIEIIGILVMNAHNTNIGAAFNGNTVVSSVTNVDHVFLLETSNTVVQGNYIGISSTGAIGGSGGSGVWVNRAIGMSIGGTQAGEGNVIAYSDDAGVDVAGATSEQVSIRGNSIYGSRTLGIDLGFDGPTSNDIDDVDSGPNGFQNWAVPVSAESSSSGGLDYVIDTTTLANGVYTVDFYASTDLDGGQVEGARYLGGVSGVPDGVSAHSFGQFCERGRKPDGCINSHCD